MKLLQLTMGVAVALTLGACAKVPSKNDFEAAITKAMDQKALCWVPQEGLEAKFPMKLTEKDVETGNYEVLSKFIDAGLVNMEVTREYRMFTSVVTDRVLTLTPEGEAAKVWDAGRGICMGRLAVDKVITVLPEFEAAPGITATAAGLTTSMKDIPGFIVDRDPDGSAEMRKPTPTKVVLLKVNNAWQVANIERN